MHPPELCPGGLWGGPVTSTTSTEAVAAAADSCYWNPPRNGNFYSPNPEVASQQQHQQPPTGVEAIEVDDGTEPRPLSRSLTRYSSKLFVNNDTFLVTKLLFEKLKKSNVI